MENLVTALHDLLIKESIFKYFFAASNIIALCCWITTLLTNNFSQIDRLWPILPTIYAWGFMYTSVHYHRNSERVTLMASLITMWCVRLTYNYWRKGGYSKGEEDYRWTHVKKMFYYPDIKIIFHIFNFVFIAFIQNWLLLGLAVPLWFVQNQKYEPLNYLDYLLAILFVVFFAIEVTADEQQWNFQQNKKKLLKESNKQNGDFKRGFLSTGLFRYSRHPNFCGELCMWWTMYLFTVVNSHGWQLNSLVNYSIFGALVLQFIFLKSTPLTERISLAKYPKYKEYQEQVSRIIPWFSSLKFKN